MTKKSGLILIVLTVLAGPLFYLGFGLFDQNSTEPQRQLHFHVTDFKHSFDSNKKLVVKNYRAPAANKKVSCQSKAPEYAFKINYLFPAGSPNKMAQFRNLIYRDLSFLEKLYQTESGGKLKINWDYTGCKKFPLIRAYKLPFSSQYYKSLNDEKSSSALSQATEDLSSSTRINIFYVDNVRPVSSMMGGFAYVYDDSNPDPKTNYNTNAGNQAFILGNGRPGFNGKNYIDVLNRRVNLAHEFTHTLGAVISAAPYASGRGHCLEDFDVMCYQDGKQKTFVRCPRKKIRLDCGRDSYFRINHKDDYLGNHWNVANSLYLSRR